MRDFQRIVKDICDHTLLYVDDRNLSMVAAWLNGYNSSVADMLRNCASNERPPLAGFASWLSAKPQTSHGMEPNLVWWEYIARLYPSDSDALDQLPLLYDEFIAARDGEL